MLLPGPLLSLVGQFWSFAFAIPAAGLLVLGWVAMGADITTVPTRGGQAYRRRRMMIVGYVASWISLIVGLGIVAASLDQVPSIPIQGGLFFSLPYIPSLYVPVVLLQATVFVLGRQYLADPKRVRMTNAGIMVLILISALALMLQAVGLLWPWAFLLPGTLAIGYFLVSRAWFIPPVERTLSSPARAG